MIRVKVIGQVRVRLRIDRFRVRVDSSGRLSGGDRAMVRIRAGVWV